MNNESTTGTLFHCQWDVHAKFRANSIDDNPSFVCEEAVIAEDESVFIPISRVHNPDVVCTPNTYRIRGVSLCYKGKATETDDAAAVLRFDIYERTVNDKQEGFIELEPGPKGTMVRVGKLKDGVFAEFADRDIDGLGELLIIVGAKIVGSLRGDSPPSWLLNYFLENPVLAWATADCWLRALTIEIAQSIATRVAPDASISDRDRLATELLAETMHFRRELPDMRLNVAIGKKDDLSLWDAALADWIEKLGAHTDASTFREKRKALSVRKMWSAWLPSGVDDPPRGILLLARVLWDLKLKPALEEEARKPPARMSSDLAKSFGVARRFGGVLKPGTETYGPTIAVEPPKGISLSLPFDERLKVAKDNHVVGLRQVLGAAEMRTYYATLVLFQDAGFNSEGAFEIQGVGDILDLIGVGKRKDPKGRNGSRYASKETRIIREHLELFTNIRVRSVGGLEAAAGDPLLDQIRACSTGKTVTYAHSRLIVGQLQTNFFQIPRALLRLSASDVPICMGIAQVTREKVLALLKKGTAIEAPIQTWLEAAGIDPSEGARKLGRRYWEEAAEDLVRVAEEGELGNMNISGNGKETMLQLTLHPRLATSYEPLLDASKAHAKAKNRARIELKKEKMRG